MSVPHEASAADAAPRPAGAALPAAEDARFGAPAPAGR